MCGNTKFISSVHQDISLTLEINFIFPNIHVFFSLLYRKGALFPHKNRAVYSNAFHDNRHISRIGDNCVFIRGNLKY